MSAFSPWQWFLVSVALLGLGPLVAWAARHVRGLLDAMDAFVLVAVGGLVLADVLPDTWERGGWPTMVLVLAGFAGPAWLEKRLHGAARKVHTATLAVGVAGLALHAGLDGVVLGQQQSAGTAALATAVLLHRLPEGLTIWWLLAPHFGACVAVAVLAAEAMATAAGLGLASTLGGLHESTGLAWVEALVSGSLLHVLVHRPHPLVGSAATGARWAGGLGGLAGLALLPAALAGHDHGHGDATWDLFLDLARESAPALLLAYVAAGALQVFLPASSVGWMARGGRWSQALRGAAFGLPLPICSCGALPVYQSLTRQGVPTAAAIAFLVGTPELGIDAALLSVPLLGAPMAVARVVAAAVAAVVSGWVMGTAERAGWWRAPQAPTEAPADRAARTPLRHRLAAALRFGLGETVDHTGPWLLLGLGVAAVSGPLLASDAIAGLPPALQVPLWALIGMPSYVCAAGATPLVAVMLAAGISPGAGLAFLLTGPATNVSTLGVLAQLHGRRAATLFGATMAAMAIAAGWVVNAVLGDYAAPRQAAATADHAHGVVADAALAVLALLLLASLMRQGPRGMVRQVLDWNGVDGHGHGHDHSHGHSHGHGHDACCAHGHGHGHGEMTTGPASAPRLRHAGAIRGARAAPHAARVRLPSDSAQ